MKTYLIEKFKSLKAQIELLDQKAEIQKIEDEVKNILCKNPWHVFNDGDQNELYLFGENNTLSIVYAGKVTKAEWKYVKDLNSVEIATNDQIYMLQMAWLENSELLCMRLYGTNEYCFMIEDKKWETCGFKQLSDVTNHILAIEKQKEHLRIEAAKRAEEERQRLERQRFEEARRAEKEQQRQKKLRQWNEEANQLQEVQLLNSKEKPLKNKTIAFFVIVAFVCALLLSPIVYSHYWSQFGSWLCLIPQINIAFLILICLIRYVITNTFSLDWLFPDYVDSFLDGFVRHTFDKNGKSLFDYINNSVFYGIIFFIIYFFVKVLYGVLLLGGTILSCGGAVIVVSVLGQDTVYNGIIPLLLWGVQCLVSVLIYLKFYRKNHERNQCEKSRIITEYVEGKEREWRFHEDL